MDSIRTMKTDLSAVVARSVANTFGVMFRREVAPGGEGDGLAEGTGQDICSNVSLWQDDGALNVDFCFRFDRDLLHSIAKDAYPGGAQDKSLLCEDIACAVANIVVSNVKTYLNGRGFDMVMNIPATGTGPAGEIKDRQQAHLRFHCDTRGSGGDGILVNMQMQDRRGPKAG